MAIPSDITAAVNPNAATGVAQRPLVNDHLFVRQTLLLRDLHAYLLFSGL
jgi:hypothetical protein